MEMEVKARKTYAEGKHKGKITKVENVQRPPKNYKYTDVYVQPDDFDVPIKFGAPTVMSEGSKLFRLVNRFSGKPLEPGDKVDPVEVLVGRECEFVPVNEETEKGTFARIADGSLRPVGQPDVIEPENEGD
jgi:hypothetical protein